MKRSTGSKPHSAVLSTTSETSDVLVEQYVAPHPHRIGVANAWLPVYGYSVWILADALNATAGDIVRVADEYEIPKEAVMAVASYYERHREAIDARILLNALDFNATV